MNKHIIEANNCLKQNVVGFYHSDYTGYRNTGNPDFIVTLKNTNKNTSKWQLSSATSTLSDILMSDFPIILKEMKWDDAKVCVVPRAKAKNYYTEDQLLFSNTVSQVVDKIYNLNNGVSAITRHTHTRTTHLHRYDTIGSMPYCGITNDTCHISSDVSGKRIILVDDIYTKTINIDEDVIQALFDKGAESVCLYTVAKTVKKYH